MWPSGGCSLVVVEEAAEAISPLDLARHQARRWVGRLQREAAVGALGVVLLEIDGEVPGLLRAATKNQSKDSAERQIGESKAPPTILRPLQVSVETSIET